MKKIKLKIGFAIVTVVMYSMMTLSSCGNSEKNNKPKEQDYVKTSEPMPVPSVENHSQLMDDTRKWLKAELGEKYNAPLSPGTTAQLEQGKEIYKKYCTSCHGSSGKGDGPAGAALQPKAANFTDSVHATFYSDQGRILIIKKGVKGTAMAGWANTLNEEEILSVYAYVNSLKNSGEMMEHHEHSH
jgi:mono/diheme cytochrome c family protein